MHTALGTRSIQDLLSAEVLDGIFQSGKDGNSDVHEGFDFIRRVHARSAVQHAPPLSREHGLSVGIESVQETH